MFDRKAGDKIVTMVGLVSQTWAYADISFGVWNSEFIANDPAYRRRGLMQVVLAGLHIVSTPRGDLVQAIHGLRLFYHQFG